MSDAIIEKIATWVEPGVKEEKDIETAIGGVEPVLALIQSNEDAHRNEKSGLEKQIDELKKQLPNEPKKSEPSALTEEGVRNIFTELLKPISDKIAKQEQDALASERKSQILAKAKEYNIPEAVAKYMAVPDDADLDDFMKTAKQDFSNNGFSDVLPPQSAEARVKTESEQIAKMISDGTKTIVESQKQ